MWETAIRTVAVVGGGIAGLSAATAFARSLPGTAVTLVQTNMDRGALVDIVPTAWPSVSSFHRFIGLDEMELVRSKIATHHLGTIFDNWSASGKPWVHAFGSYGKPAGGIPFDQIWTRAVGAGEAQDYDRYSVGAALARANKFVHPAREPDSLGSWFEYGLRLDLERYRHRLEEHASQSGVAILGADLDRIEQSPHGIGALVLSDGTSIRADLFIDCTGPAATLRSTLDDSFEDWSAWMPFDRLTLESEESSATPATADRVRISAEGWSIHWPLRGRTIRAKLSIGGGGGALIRRGRQLRPWTKNVLAIGDAATALDPLHGMNLDVTHRAILLALELLPGRDFNQVETSEYNRRAGQQTQRVRDFLALHYLCCGRLKHLPEFLVSEEPPCSLANTLDQYQFRGRLPFYEEESISRDSWSAAFIGMGVFPTHVDPQSEMVPLATAAQRMNDLAREIGEAVARLPTYEAYLGSLRI